MFGPFEIPYSLIPPYPQAEQSILRNPILHSPYRSARFPLYPIEIIITTRGDPFSKIQCGADSIHAPTSVQIHLSNDMQNFSLVGTLKFDIGSNLLKSSIRTLQLSKLVNPQYIKVRILAAKKDKNNLCKQIQINGIRLFAPKYQGTRYLYNLQAYFVHPEPVLIALQQLQMAIKVASSQKNFELCARMDIQMKGLLDLSKKYSAALQRADSNTLQQLQTQISHTCNEYGVPIQRPPAQKSKKPAVVKPTQPAPPAGIPQQLRNIFGKYPNRVQHKQMVFLTSGQFQKFIIDIWYQVTTSLAISQQDEALLLQTFHYFINQKDQNLLRTIIHIMSMMFKLKGVGFKHPQLYSQLQGALIRKLDPPTHVLHEQFKGVILSLHEFMEDPTYLDILIHINSEVPGLRKQKLELLSSLLGKHQFSQYTNIINFCKKTLRALDSSKVEKQLSYICLTKIAQRMGNKQLLDQMDDLPTHLLLNLQKILTKGSRPQTSKSIGQKIQEGQTCKYCQKKDPSFTDPDLYDLHCFQDCLFLTQCKHCQAIVQIPDLYKHYLKECEKSKYTTCQQCGRPVLLGEMQTHLSTECRKDHIIQCPLCLKHINSQRQVKTHIIKGQCHKNKRSK